jgi:predicted transcriptional regulator
MKARNPGPPLRAIAWIVDAWSLDILSDWLRFFGGDRCMVEIYLFVMAANTQHLFGDAALAARRHSDPVTLADCRPVKIVAIAAGLGLDGETVRRKVIAMRAAGHCLVDRRGVIVNLADAGSAVFTATAGGMPARLATLVTRLQSLVLDTGYNAAAVAELRTALDLDVTRLAAPEMLVTLLVSRHMARAMFPSTSLFGADRDSAAIYLTVYVENGRAMANDPRLSHADGWIDSELPAEARQPISVSDIARRLSLPAETARRRTNRLIDRGMIERVVGGVVVIRTFTVAPVHAPRLYQELRAMLAKMARSSRRMVRTSWRHRWHRRGVLRCCRRSVTSRGKGSPRQAPLAYPFTALI